MKTYKKIAIGFAILLTSFVVFEIGSYAYFKSLSYTEQCVITAQIQVLKQSPFESIFYEDQPYLERFCAAINHNR